MAASGVLLRCGDCGERAARDGLCTRCRGIRLATERLLARIRTIRARRRHGLPTVIVAELDDREAALMARLALLQEDVSR